MNKRNKSFVKPNSKNVHSGDASKKRKSACSSVASCLLMIFISVVVLSIIISLSPSDRNSNSRTSQKVDGIKTTDGNEDTPLDEEEDIETVEEKVAKQEDVEGVEEIKEEVKEEVKEEKIEKVEKSQTLEERIIDYVNGELGAQTNMEEETVRKVFVVDDIVVIQINTSDNFTAKMVKRGIRMDIMDIFGSNYSYSYEDGIFQLDDIITRVEVQAFMNLLDLKGNEVESIQMRVIFNRDTYESIKWENFDFDNLQYVADEYWEGSYLVNIDI